MYILFTFLFNRNFWNSQIYHSSIITKNLQNSHVTTIIDCCLIIPYILFILKSEIFIMKPTLAHSLNGFDSITLDQLNSTMSLMERVDTKYILSYSQADEFIKMLKNKFFILQIKDKVIFQYDNIYMDTENNDLFYEHENGLEMRNKVRTRNYTDSEDLCFFEYKHKMNKVTRKFRYRCPATEHWVMTEEAEGFFAGVYESLNWETPGYKLSASLATRYQRISLCAKDSGEKVTIDFGFQLEDLRSGIIHNLDEIIIVESKSNNEHCSTWRIMKRMKISQAKWCSKYCLWLLYTKRITESQRFADTMEYMNSITDAANLEKETQSEKVIRTAVKRISKVAKTATKNPQSNTSKIHSLKESNWFSSKKLVAA